MAHHPPNQWSALPDDLPFGPKISVPKAHTFAATALSYAFVNLKPVVPGHVLVSPRRLVPRLGGLTPEENADLFGLVARVAAAVEAHTGAAASTLALQDGPAAGQTVPHVHVHVLPRTPGDFARNDDIYTAIEEGGAGGGGRGGGRGVRADEGEDRPPRSAQEMAAEATTLRALFP